MGDIRRSSRSAENFHECRTLPTGRRPAVVCMNRCGPSERGLRDIRPCSESLTPAAANWHMTRVTPASIVEPAVPTAPESPFGPGPIIAILAVGVSRFPGRTIDALGVAARAGACVPGRCRPCCQGKSHDSAENFEFHHAFLHSQNKNRIFHGAVRTIEMAQRAPQPAVAFLSEFQSATRHRMLRLACVIAGGFAWRTTQVIIFPRGASIASPEAPESVRAKVC